MDCPVHGKKLSKYHSRFTEVDGIRFQSKREADHYGELKLAKTVGALKYFLRQVPFHLPGNVVYRVDFMEVWDNGQLTFTDTKGYRTKEFITKKKQVESLYPVCIGEA